MELGARADNAPPGSSAGALLVYGRSAPYTDLVHQDVNYEAEADRLHRIISCRAPHGLR